MFQQAMCLTQGRKPGGADKLSLFGRDGTHPKRRSAIKTGRLYDKRRFQHNIATEYKKGEAFRQWFEDVEASEVELPPESFKETSTGAYTQLLYFNPSEEKAITA